MHFSSQLLQTCCKMRTKLQFPSSAAIEIKKKKNKQTSISRALHTKWGWKVLLPRSVWNNLCSSSHDHWWLLSFFPLCLFTDGPFWIVSCRWHNCNMYCWATVLLLQSHSWKESNSLTKVSWHCCMFSFLWKDNINREGYLISCFWHFTSPGRVFFSPVVKVFVPFLGILHFAITLKQNARAAYFQPKGLEKDVYFYVQPEFWA